ncbi:hypothetical protein INT44_003206 [Umbelopsis vinacea]|uniref:Mitochondrial carrier n=1 Tax=Umbelopsis vinacea TaxID=44442 RepID=A0A8H7Q6X1_9FUNG|nr:hypothetical protein INT44_003206 [Umbelopsis vinacea]
MNCQIRPLTLAQRVLSSNFCKGYARQSRNWNFALLVASMSTQSKKKSLLNSTMAGAGAGAVEVLIMQPTDVIKTRFQSLRAASLYNQGIWKAFTKVVKDEGFLGTLLNASHVNRYYNLTLASPALYRGTVPVLCIVGPRVSLQYMGLAMYKPIFEKLEGKVIPSHSSAGLAGVCTGITQAVTLVTPLEAIKVRQQTDLMNAAHERKYHGIAQTARTMIKTEGFMSLYNGLIPTVVRQSWGTEAQIVSILRFFFWVSKLTIMTTPIGLLVKFSGYIEIKAIFEATANDPSQPLAPWKHMVSGGLANVLVAVLNSPPDVVKTRMQDEGSTYRNTWQCVKSMAREEGFRSFFRGSWLRVIRVAPGGAIQFAMYEQLSHWLENRE